MDKKAYPQDDNGTFANPPHNVEQWMKFMQIIYAQAPAIGWRVAFDRITSDWDNMEKQDFKSWMNFYQENGHQKYKTAQFLPNNYVENGGTFIPVDSLKGKLPVREPDMSSFVSSQNANATQDKDMQKLLVERKIQSLIGRLNSAEKIATNPQVQLALKKCLQMSVDEWVSLLQKLKREIQLAPMRFSTASLLNDIVYRNANQAYAAGYKQAGIMLVKVAQMTPAPTSMPGEGVGGGVVPMTPADTPMAGQPVAPKDSENAAPNGDMAGAPQDKDAIKQFLNNLNFGDVGKVEDELEVDDLEIDDEAEITVTAQAAPGAEDLPLSPNPAPALDPKPRKISPQLDVPSQNTLSNQDTPGDLEVSEDEVLSDLATSGDPFDQALSSVEVKDIVTRLEGIASMFKNRQIARQLSIIDLMMDKLGIAPFFPTLAEAMRSALESNQYCQSRVEDILAKLRGTISTPMSQHLEGDLSGENDQIKAQLANQEEAEEVRKERRKMLQDQKETEALAPQLSPGQQLAGPAQIQVAPPVRPVG